MSQPQAEALRQPLSLRLTSGVFLVIWMLIAAFPLFWIAVMSFKLPVDSFSANPLAVIFGPDTRLEVGGLSPLDIVLAIVGIYFAIRFARHLAGLARMVSIAGQAWLGWIVAVLIYTIAVLIFFVGIVPAVSAGLRDALGGGFLLDPILGATLTHYYSVWVDNEFYHQFVNSLIVTAGVVTISLTVGTVAAYAIARTGSSLAFWLLIAALIFRALPHSVLVTGYLPPFVNSREILMPLWESGAVGWFFNLFSDEPPTLYGRHWAVIIVLVSINQPFTIWMLRSFFMSIPAELDEAARVDGCSHFQAFRRVIIPVMWPGVITTGLFSFLLAYNDYLVTSLLLDAQSQTMVPAISGYFNRETTTTDQVEAVAAAVSIIAPLFILIMVFQRQIVSGLTAGAVKG